MAEVKLKARMLAVVPVTISGEHMIQHQWSEKAKQQLRDKHAGKKTKNRDPRDKDAEFKAAMYRTKGGKHAVPAMAIKTAMISAAHKDIGIEKTLVRKAVRIVCDDPNMMLEMECSKPWMREDLVVVNNGAPDLRYRPHFDKWSTCFVVQLDESLLTVQDLFTLVDLAGFSVGIGEWRPEKNGEYGRFTVVSKAKPKARKRGKAA